MTTLAILSVLFAGMLVGVFARSSRRRSSQRELVGLVELLAQLAYERRTG
jgi:hypothetical protein